MKVVIFCGGQGTRMREETEFRPKPMVTLGTHPILWHIMKTYASFGHREFVLCLGYKGDMIKQYFLHYRAMNSDFTIRLGHPDQTKHVTFHDAHPEEDDFTVTFSDTGEDTMTGARLAFTERFIDDDIFLCTYGDGLCDVDINKVIEFHKSHGKIATVTSVKTISRFGILDVDNTGKVEKFAEKPDVNGWINAGYFVFDKRIFEYTNTDPSTILEKQVMEVLAENGELMAYHHDGFFYAMDTYREWKILNDLWNKKEAPWAHWLLPSLTKNATWNNLQKHSGKTNASSLPEAAAL
jgi:glucose-1-phosphate cytidylyltransferase